MADLEKLRANLEARGFRTTYFPTAYLDGQIDGKTVGIGGSMTVKEMGLYPRLAAHNQVVWHWEGGALRDAVLTDVYITSANALAETGEIVNIDGADEIAHELQRIGNNLNQIARYFNEGGLMTNPLAKELHHALQEIDKLVIRCNEELEKEYGSH